MDRYDERLVKGKTGLASVMALIASILLTMMGAVLLILSPPLGLLIFAGGIALIVFAKDGLSIEYEYIITNGDIEISKIIAKKRRKNIMEITADSISKMDYADSDRTKNDLSLGKHKVREFIGPEIQEKEVAIYYGEGDASQIAILDLNDKCIDQLRSVLKMKSEI